MAKIVTTVECPTDGQRLYFDPAAGFFCDSGHKFATIEQVERLAAEKASPVPPVIDLPQVEVEAESVVEKAKSIPVRSRATQETEAQALPTPKPLRKVSDVPQEGIVEMANGDVYVTVRIEQHYWSYMTAAVEGGRWAANTFEWFKKQLIQCFENRSFW